MNQGHSPAVCSPPAAIERRLMWRKWLKGGVAAIAFSGAVALFWVARGTVPPLEATAQMERLAAKVERAQSIPPDTVREITRLIGQPWYDCNQVACNAQLQARNSAVRNRLKTLIATKTPLNDFAGARKRSSSLSLMPPSSLPDR